MSETIYRLPEEYDLEHAGRNTDIEFYIAFANRLKPRRVLELGCGTGRVTIPLAVRCDAVEHVTGLDAAPEMLRQARRKARPLDRHAARKLRWVRGDLRTWQDQQPFDLVIAPCGTLCHLLPLDDQMRAWKTAGLNLKTGGHFVADVPTPNLAQFAESFHTPPRAIVEIDNDTRRMIRGGRTRLLRYKAVTYDAAQQRAFVRYLYDEFQNRRSNPNRFLSDYEHHVYYPRELELLFRSAGFEVEFIRGGFEERPLENGSQTIVICGVKA